MKHLLITSLILLGSASAYAEVFTCKQADGTTVFAHVPCRTETKPVVFAPVPEIVIPEASATNIRSDIARIEDELDDLRKTRDEEIAAAPFSTSNPDLLTNLKSEIRADYQSKIDAHLEALVELRTRQKSLLRGA